MRMRCICCCCSSALAAGALYGAAAAALADIYARSERNKSKPSPSVIAFISKRVYFPITTNTASSRAPIAPDRRVRVKHGFRAYTLDAFPFPPAPTNVPRDAIQPPKLNERSPRAPFSLFYARVEQSTWLDPSLKRVRLRRIDRRGAERRPVLARGLRSRTYTYTLNSLQYNWSIRTLRNQSPCIYYDLTMRGSIWGS